MCIAVTHDGGKEHVVGETEISNDCAVSCRFGCHLKLYDLNVDPGEFNDLWNDPNASDVKNRLIRQSFDATMLAQDLGPPRIGPM